MMMIIDLWKVGTMADYYHYYYYYYYYYYYCYRVISRAESH